MLAAPEVDGVNVDVHVAVPAARVHVVNVPEAVPVTVRVTVPVGVRTVPAVDVSVTVAVHVDV